MAVMATRELDPAPVPLLAQLSRVCTGRGLAGLAERLGDLGAFVGDDLAECEAALAALPRGTGAVEKSAHHLIALGGKRLRPLCVALASRVGTGFSTAARECAVAVELVHNATLLHDDVVDVGELRRGAATARSVYGNAASIFAGDWLLVEALRRVQRVALPGALERLLVVIDEMIRAEAAQLEARGKLTTDRTGYFSIIEGKTAALFRWALFAGGRAGGLSQSGCAALEGYGLHLGVAFQAVDDLLDLTGGAATGKALFADLREGKMTFPLIVALEREPALRAVLEEVLASSDAGEIAEDAVAAVLESLARTGAVEECRALARHRALLAVAELEQLPASAARTALEVVASATAGRDR
jgi:octaprenyl-diphosphate synthase